MDPSRLRQLFDHALALPPTERETFLEARCPEPELRAQLDRMLRAAAEGTDGPLLRDPVALSRDIGATSAGRRREIGQVVGGYRIDALLGEGGSSRVYRATRAVGGANQTVALKILHQGGPSEPMRAMFDRERIALTRLEHPGIARFIDAGVSEFDEAWIALEYVDGEPLLDHLHRTGLSRRERVRLMIEIAQAVSAAHRNLVVHRDLKPGNVLVGVDGRIRLLDFGIAKLLVPAASDPTTTRTQWRAFTPAYAAPEQRDGGVITTATDVYALGVMLGELVEERTLGAVRSGAERTTERGLPGPDLDNIVRKATALSPDERYATAAAFADDLQRLLDGLPVLAHPPSGWYRARKFVVRHRGSVLAAASASCAVLAALSIALWQSGIARREAQRAQAVTTFLLQVFEAAQDRLPSNQRASLRDVAEAARGRVGSDHALDADTRVEVLRTLGDVSEIGTENDTADALYVAALDSLGAAAADDPRRVAIEVRRVAVRAKRGEYTEALAAAEALAARAPEDDIDSRLRLLDVRAGASQYLGRHDAAASAARERVTIATAAYGALDQRTLRAEAYLGNMLALQGRHPEALAQLDATLEKWRAAELAHDSHYIAALQAHAVSLGAIGRLDDAVSRFEALLRAARSVFRSPHDRIASALRNYASNLSIQGREDEAVAAHREANAMYAALYGEEHRHVLAGRNRLAQALERAGRRDEAETEYRTVVAVCEHSGIRDSVCPVAKNGLGIIYRRLGRLDEARRWGEAALAANRALYGKDEQNVASTLITLSSVASADGRSTDAIDLAAQAVAVYEALGTTDGPQGAFGRASYAKALRLGGRHADALVQIERAIEAFDRAAPGDLPNRTDMRVQLAHVLLALGREAESREVALQAVALGADGARLPASNRVQLRELTGRRDLYPGLD